MISIKKCVSLLGKIPSHCCVPWESGVWIFYVVIHFTFVCLIGLFFGQVGREALMTEAVYLVLRSVIHIANERFDQPHSAFLLGLLVCGDLF
jgi:hypothetical protein